MIHSLIKNSFILLVVFLVSLTFALIYAFYEIKLDADKLIDYNPPTSSLILDSKGRMITYLVAKNEEDNRSEHRIYAKYDEIPGDMVEALVAIEDTQFFEHKGINPSAIMRAMLTNFKSGTKKEGGSTLTQQLIKNELLTSEKSYTRKIREMILAMKIENALSKEEILERYLNKIYFGKNYYGVKTAAMGYFNKNLDELTLKECAMLAGMPKAPSQLDPTKHYDKTLDRANTVLNRMKEIKWITQEEYLEAVKETPKVYADSITHNNSPYVSDEVVKRLQKEFPNIKSGGYTIYTTIDLTQQHIAEEALRYAYENALRSTGENRRTTTLNGAIIAIDNATGDIKALVGGVDYEKSQFNRATMMVRQPGSAFKPFIYQTALDIGYNPATQLTDVARTFQYYENGRLVTWKPKNYEGDYLGFVNMREALVHSRNLATINLVTEIGLQRVLDKLASLNLAHVPQDMSISLGNLGLSPMDMAHMYTIFASGGDMKEPRLISKVVARKGNVIWESPSNLVVNFTTPQQAYLMTSMLQDVISRGTGTKGVVAGVELAGKTGTTNEGVDAWFCGYSPTTELIVWMGRDNNKPISRKATGGSISGPAFSYFFKHLYQKYPNMQRRFVRPQGVWGEGSLIYTNTSPLPIQPILPEPTEQNITDDNDSVTEDGVVLEEPTEQNDNEEIPVQEDDQAPADEETPAQEEGNGGM
ncbi:MAG: PBP1A family penicillin-binding protein [Epsilonproteobacteria bacterium]|nr:PBP1A family penicillin-binding protein [Campylobacterota bacterium]